MITEKEYLKAKKIVDAYEKQLQINQLNKASCVHKWKYLSGSPHNELHQCVRCGAIG